MNQPWVYIVLVGLVLIVYAKVLPKSSSSSRSENTGVKEMEEAMEHFAAELDEQNQAIVQLFTETKQSFELHLTKLTGRIEWLEKQNSGFSQEIARLQAAHEHMEKQLAAVKQSASAVGDKLFFPTADTAPPAAIPASESVPVSAPDLMNIKERYAELFALYHQGKSTDYIAKKLGMNKGEINLIIQLAKQEESLRA